MGASELERLDDKCDGVLLCLPLGGTIPRALIRLDLPRATTTRLAPLVLLLAVVAVACATGTDRLPEATIGSAATAESGQVDQPSPDAEGSAEPTPSALPSPAPSAAREPTVLDTAWGAIWDRLPDGFPVHPAARPIEVDASDEPVSAAFAIDALAPEELAPWMQAALEGATYSTEALSGPLEDDSFVLDSVGDGDCRIETTLAPGDGGTTVTVRYGADCPHD